MVQKTKAATVGRQLLQGGTLGFSDEISDRLAAAIAAAATDLTYGEALNQARDLTKEAQAYDWDENKALSLGSNTVGGIPLGLTKAGLSGANWVRNAATGLGSMGRGAALGAGYGGVAGFGAGSDSFGDRLSSGVMGGLFGLGLGGATAPLSRIGSGKVDYNKLGKKAAKYAQTPAGKEIAKELGMRPDLPEILRRAEKLDAAAKKSGINLTLAEKIAQSTSDPLLAKQGLLKQNPMTAGQMENFYKARLGTIDDEGQIVKALRDYASKTGAQSYDEAAQSLIEAGQGATKRITSKLVSEAEPFYKEAFKANPNMYSKRLDRILATPEGKKALRETAVNFQNEMKLMAKPDKELGEIARELASYGKIKDPKGGVAKGLSLKALDAIKKRLDQSVSSAKKAAEMGSSSDADRYRALEAVRKNLVDELDALDITAKAGPNSYKIDGGSYAKARGVYSGQPEQLQMRKLIGDVAKIDPMQAQKVARALYSGTPETAKVSAQALGKDAPKAVSAKIYQVLGAMRNPTDEGTGLTTSLANKIAPTADMAEMLRTYGAGDDLMDTLKVINQAKLGDRFISGSPTQPLGQGQSLLADAANTAIDAKTGGATALMRRMAGALSKKQDNPEFYQDLSRIMTTDEGMDLLRRTAFGQGKALQKTTPSPIMQSASQIPVPYTGMTTGQVALSGTQSIPQGVVRSSVSAVNAPQQQSYNPNNDMELQKMLKTNVMQYNPDTDEVLQKMLGGY